MARVSTYPNKEAEEINQYYRLFGTNDNKSNSPQVNIPIGLVVDYVKNKLASQGLLNSLPIQEVWFDNQTSVYIEHHLGRPPKVVVIIGIEEILTDIQHINDNTAVLVSFTNPQTGVIHLI